MSYSLYELINPIDDSVFYIGLTSNARNRLKRHCQTSKFDWKHNPLKTKIVYELKKNGLIPKLNVLFDSLSKEEAENLEIDMIEKLRILGYTLTNISIGGNLPSIETRKKLSDIGKLKKISLKQIDAMRQANIGKLRSDYVKQQVSKANKGRPAHNKGVPMNKEQKTHLSILNTKYSFITKEFLQEHLFSQKKTRTELAKEFGCSRTLFRVYLKKFGMQ